MYLKKKKINNLEAMILAAGRGKRMRYMTNFLAKPLIKINRISILEIIIKNLASSGIKKIVVNSSYMHLSIKKFLKELNCKSKLPKIVVSFEKIRLETGGGLKNAISKFDKSKLLVINGDSLLNYTEKSCPIFNLYSNFDEKNMDILLLLSEKKNTLGYKGRGDYRKTSFSYTSKLTKNNSNLSTKYIFTGWQIINKKLLDNFSEKNFSLNKVFDLAEKNQRLFGIIHEDLFFHIGDPKAYNLINKYVKFRKIRFL